MKNLILSLLALGFSHNALAADFSITGAEGWKVIPAEGIEAVVRIVCAGTPAADFIITKESDTPREGEEAKPQTTLCVRKIKSDKASLLKDVKEDWRRILWSKSVLQKMAFINERPVKSNDLWKYTVDATLDIGKKVPQMLAGSAQVVGGDIYVVMFEQNADLFNMGIKDVRELLKTVSVEVKK